MYNRLTNSSGHSLRRGTAAAQCVRFMLALGMLTLIAGTALAFSSGPPNGRTNAPGEGNCTACHNSFPLQPGENNLSVGGIGGIYTPGEAYTLELTLSDPEAMRWGFEFTILNTAEVSVGELMALDGNTQTSATGDREYAKHTSAGTFAGTAGSATWQVMWIAPDPGAGDVTLYVAGNAANNNGNNSGDLIYATSFSYAEVVTAVGDTPVLARLLPNYPNPFNPMTTISFELPVEQNVNLTIYAVDGRRVKTLIDGSRGSGLNAVNWDGTDHAGRAMPSGTYLYQLRTGQTVATERMVLAR